MKIIMTRWDNNIWKTSTFYSMTGCFFASLSSVQVSYTHLFHTLENVLHRRGKLAQGSTSFPDILADRWQTYVILIFLERNETKLEHRLETLTLQSVFL